MTEGRDLVLGSRGIPPQISSSLTAALGKISPEAIKAVVDTIRDIIQTNASMALKDQDFNQQFKKLMASHNNKIDLLRDLTSLLASPKLHERDVSQIVASICKIAERVND